MSLEDREEVEQEVMTQIWQSVSRPSFEPDARFWGFVEVVTARRSIDWLRRRRAEPVPLPGVADEVLAAERADPLSELLAEERTRLVSDALARLGRPCRELIDLRIGSRQSYREISLRLGRSEGALRVRMHRCIDEVRRLLQPRRESADRGAREEDR